MATWRQCAEYYLTDVWCSERSRVQKIRNHDASFYHLPLRMSGFGSRRGPLRHIQSHDKLELVYLLEVTKILSAQSLTGDWLGCASFLQQSSGSR